MLRAARLSRVSGLRFCLLLAIAGCDRTSSAGPGTHAYAYRDAEIPASEHGDIVLALKDLAGVEVRKRLAAEIYLDGRGFVLGDRLVPYLEQVRRDEKAEADVRLTATRLIIKHCRSGSKALLAEFLASEHLAVRCDAYKRLVQLTGREWDYRYDAPAEERAEAVERIRRQLEP